MVADTERGCCKGFGVGDARKAEFDEVCCWSLLLAAVFFVADSTR
jgi:hypothetical protein